MNKDPFASRVAALDAAVNPYVALLRDGVVTGDLPIVFGADLANYAGNWAAKIADYHGRKTPFRGLVAEIGCHKGVTLLAMAKANPDVAFLGIDITFKRVVTTAQRVKSLGLKNVYLTLANASGIGRLFTPQELAGCVIFFPDPWVKKLRQAKNRLMNAAFAEALHTALGTDGFCWLKTDQKIYFDEASTNLAAAGFAQLAPPPLTPSLEALPTLDGAAAAAGRILRAEILSRDYSSAFEQRFHAQNLPTYGAQWGKHAAVVY